VTLPLLDCGSECFVHRFLGEIEVSDEADERREDPPPLLAVEALDAQPAISRIGRTSIEPVRDVGIRAAMDEASARSFAATM
jgi:hypothetical protein